MPKEVFYRQCELERGSGQERRRLVSWIPEQHAVVGKRIRLKDDGRWSDGWKVISVGETRRPEQEAMDRSRDHLHQRDASDL